MTPGRRLGIVTGLPAETRAAGTRDNGNTRILCCGASSAQAESHARALVEWGAAGLVSFGIAGGLRPGLPAGTIVIATEVIAPGGTIFPLDGGWADRLAVTLPPSLDTVRAPVAGSDRPVADAFAKAALAASSGAAAVDMESHAVAVVGERARLPVISIRAIADPAGRSLPASVLAALRPNGEPNVGRMFFELCRRPRELARLAATAIDYRRALGSLRRVALSGGPDFGLFS